MAKSTYPWRRSWCPTGKGGCPCGRAGAARGGRRCGRRKEVPARPPPVPSSPPATSQTNIFNIKNSSSSTIKTRTIARVAAGVRIYRMQLYSIIGLMHFQNTQSVSQSCISQPIRFSRMQNQFGMRAASK